MTIKMYLDSLTLVQKKIGQGADIFPFMATFVRTHFCKCLIKYFSS